MYVFAFALLSRNAGGTYHVIKHFGIEDEGRH